MNSLTAYKLDILQNSIEARHREIAEYEINIFNYEFILSELQSSENPDSTFLAQIQEGIASNNREMEKSKSVLRALNAQISYLSSLT